MINLATAALLALAAAAAGQVTIQDVGSNLRPTAVSSTGAVVGYAQSGYYRPFMWTAGSGSQLLPTFAGDPAAVASGINSAGQIVGESFPQPYNAGRAVRWDGASLTDLGVLAGDIGAGANDINDAGQICGTSMSDTGTFRPFIWTPSQGMQQLSGITAGQARAINSAGQVTGYIGDDHLGGPFTAYRWTAPGSVQPLGVLAGFQWSFGEGINDTGNVAGWCRRSGGPDAAFLWTQAGGLMNLGSLGGGDADARGLNNFNHVVGDSAGRAFLWRPGLGMIDLNTLLPPESGWVLQYAVGINDAEQIVGFGILNGVDHTWMMTIPAPGTGVLLLAALFRRRRPQ